MEKPKKIKKKEFEEFGDDKERKMINEVIDFMNWAEKKKYKEYKDE